jgi:hypothetical protein
MKNKKKELVHFFFSYQKKYLHIGIGAAFLLPMNVLLQLPMPLDLKGQSRMFHIMS